VLMAGSEGSILKERSCSLPLEVRRMTSVSYERWI
jgi:hypothetical protein